MTNLRTAAQQMLEALEGGADSWQLIGPAIDALKEALVEDAMQKFTDVSQEIEAALAEPVQEPVKQCMAHGECFGGECIYQCPSGPVQEGCDHCNHPMYAAIKCRVCGRVTEPPQDHFPDATKMVQEPVAWLTPGQDLHLNNPEGFRFSDWTPLYPAPPQRKPLAEWQINDLMADIDPEDRDSWSFRQGVYAAEKHHGVRR